MNSDIEADLLIVGGGINGAGIARDAAGRGLRVVLVEQEDLGGATSSASSKLIHGGLRYLEQLEFRLVSEALREREVLLRTARHLVHPLRFVMPHVPGLRPAWLVRTGLFLYDRLAQRETLPRSAAVDLREPPHRGTLHPRYTRGYAYSDCRVDDARLALANARAAADLGARILTRTRCIGAQRRGTRWRARLTSATGESIVLARALVNAAGPWVSDFLMNVVGVAPPARLKLVQGSHIVVPRLYPGEHAYILQNDDRRVVFVCPFEREYTLIGTTEVELVGAPRACAVSAAEIEYLCESARRYFVREVSPREVVWSYCGVRALVDEGARSASALSREYVLHVQGGAADAPLLSVYGGKITTYRRLAERALAKLAPSFPGLAPPWTARTHLPGAGFRHASFEALCDALVARYPRLPPTLLRALAARHGSLTPAVLAGAGDTNDLGEAFGADLYAREIDYFMDREWASTPEDVLWRRTKAGLCLTRAQRERLAAYLAARHALTV